MLKNFSFGSEIFLYIRNELEQGNKLAQALQQLPIEKGHAFTYIPIGSPEMRAHDPHEMYMLDTPEVCAERDAKSVELMLRHLTSHPTALALLETFHYATDNWQNKHKLAYIVDQRDVYFYFDSSNVGANALLDALRDARHYPFIAALTHFSTLPVPTWTPGETIDQAFLETVAKNTTYIILGIYDDEGYLVWSRE